jgi:YVTN family beta-propeller protein
MLDARGGTLLVTTPVDALPSALAVAAGLVCVVTNSAAYEGTDSVDVLDAASGRFLRSFAIVPRARALASLAILPRAHAMAVSERLDRALVTDSREGTVSLLTLRRGQVLHTLPVGPVPLAVAMDEHTGHAFVVNVATQPNGVPGGPGTVSVLDARRGHVLRTVTVGALPVAVAVDGRHGRVFVANEGEDTVSMLDARTGAVLATIAVGHLPHGMSVSERTGRLFITDGGDSAVWVLDAASGRVVRTVLLGDSATALAVAERTNRVFALMGQDTVDTGRPGDRGTVYVLDGRSGRILGQVPVGLNPRALAVDEHSGHVFVANMHGDPAGHGGVSLPVGWGQRWLPAWGQHWLSRLAQSPSPLRTLPGTVTILDPSRL